MHTSLRLVAVVAVVALLVAACGGAVESTTTRPANLGEAVQAPAESSPVASTDAPEPDHGTATCLEPDQTPFRSRYTETTEGYDRQVLREIHGNAAQWISTYPDGATDTRPEAQVILGGETWNLDGAGWERFPVVPIRWPILPWVNGYVNGDGVAAGFEQVGREPVAGLPATVYRGGVTEMTNSFPGKMRGREFDPESTAFTYWVDDCGDLLRADVLVELDGEERDIALEIGLSTTSRYEYVVYDVGEKFTIHEPEPSYLPAIPPPSGK